MTSRTDMPPSAGTTRNRMPTARSSATAQAVLRERRHLLRVVDELRINLPPKYPVVVQVSRLPGHLQGDCCLVGRKFRIRVCRDLPLTQAIDVLLHEWAHAMSWHACVGKVARSQRISDHEFDRLAHGPKWGIAYSKVYICFTSEIEPRLCAEALNNAVREGRRVLR